MLGWLVPAAAGATHGNEVQDQPDDDLDQADDPQDVDARDQADDQQDQSEDDHGGTTPSWVDTGWTFPRDRVGRYTPLGEHVGGPPPPTVRAVGIRLAIVNDYEVVVHGLASMLRSYSDRVEVVELDLNAQPATAVDIALFDTFAQSFRDRERIARLVQDPRIGKVVVYTWSAEDPLVN